MVVILPTEERTEGDPYADEVQLLVVNPQYCLPQAFQSDLLVVEHRVILSLGNDAALRQIESQMREKIYQTQISL